MNNKLSVAFVAGLLVAFTLASSNACNSRSPVKGSETPASPLSVLPDKAASATGDEQPVTIRFACPAQDQAEFEALAAEFHARNPSIRVEIVTVEDILAGDFKDIILKLVSAADTLYFRVDLRTAQNGLLRDLTPFIEADTSFEPEDFFPHMLEAFTLQGGTWALPSQAWLLFFLLYDKEMFDRAGVPYPTLEWTQVDFLAAAQQLTLRQGDDVVQYGFVDPGGEARDAFVLPTLTSDLMGNQPPLGAPVVVDAVRWYTDLALRHHVMPESWLTQESLDQARALIEAGKAAMWSGILSVYVGMYRRSEDVSREVGLALFPAPTGPTAIASMYGYMMSAGTGHPQESWRWLRFLSRQRLLGPGGIFADALPARRSVAEQSGYWARFDAETADLVRYAAEHLTIAPDTEQRMQLGKAINAVLRGQPVEKALAEAQTALEESLAPAAQATPVPVVVATPRPGGTAGETTIAFAPSGPDTATYHRLAAAFNQEHLDIRVQIVSPNEATSADCFAGLRSVADAGSRAELLNLQPLLEADTSFSLDDFSSRFLDAFRYRGDLWGLPTQAQVRVMFYNRHLFNAAGVPYPEPGWTLDDFLARAVALTRGSGDEKQYGFLPLNGTVSDLPVFVALQGVSLWDDRDRPRFDAPEVVAAVRWYTDLALKHGVMPTFPDDLLGRPPAMQETRNALVREGRVAMWTDFTGIDRSDVWPADAQVAMAPLPVGAEGITEFLYEGLFIAADTPYRQACWEWLKFASGQPALVRGLPARRSLFDSADFVDQVGHDALETYRTSLDYAELRMPAAPEAGAQLHWLYQALADILTGASPEAVLAEAQQQAER